jgi:hypothetical protein
MNKVEEIAKKAGVSVKEALAVIAVLQEHEREESKRRRDKARTARRAT